MRAWLRDNSVIAAGIALPVVVVVLFAAVQFVPRWLTPAPRHDLIVARADGLDGRRASARVEIGVDEGRVRARTVQTDVPRGGLVPIPRLFRYDADARRIVEIALELPDGAESLPSGTPIPIPELEGVEVSPLLEAPDGYVFEGERRRSGSLFGAVFGTNRGREAVLIRKGAAIVEIPLPATTPYYPASAGFVGWVLSE